MRKAPKRGRIKKLLLDRINRIFGFIVFTLSGRKSERQSRFSENLKPALKSDYDFCLSSGKAKKILYIL